MLKTQLFVGICIMLSLQSASQEYKDWSYDIEKDTLLKLGDQVFVSYRNGISRKDLLGDVLFASNIEGLEVKSFVMTTFSLGNEIFLKSNSNALTISMKNAIKNQDIKYKFVNFKDFILVDEEGNEYAPSLRKIKLIFLD